MNAPPLEGRNAVVTGGGRGIGAAIARALAEAGAGVIVAARTAGEIEATAVELAAAGHRVSPVPCDVTDRDSVANLAAAAIERLDGIDILVQAAGVAHSAPLGRTTLEQWERIFAVNVTGTFLCARAFLPGMVERGQGRVVNVASVAGLVGAKYISAYSASKHAVVGFTRSLADEVGGTGVTVNAVCPGYVDTPMTELSIARIAEKTGRSAAAARDALLSSASQRRLIDPREVAHAVLWLCGEESRGVNGQAIVIDGGALRT